MIITKSYFLVMVGSNLMKSYKTFFLKLCKALEYEPYNSPQNYIRHNMTSYMKFNGDNIMFCHVYDVDESLHEFSHCINKKNLGKIVQVFFFLTSKRCHIMKGKIIVTIYKQQVPIVAKSKQESFLKLHYCLTST